MRRSALFLLAEPFVLVVLGLASVLFLFSQTLRKTPPHARARDRGLRRLSAVRYAAIALGAVAIVLPAIGPAILAAVFGLTLVVLINLKT